MRRKEKAWLMERNRERKVKMESVEEEGDDLRMEREVMVAVLESFDEDDPLHSSTISSHDFFFMSSASIAALVNL